MIFYLVAWTAWTCPGGWFGRAVPPRARPLLCEPAARVEAFDRLGYARARVAELGPGATLTSCRGLRCREIKIAWKLTPEEK